jgi:transcriptional regulator with XRE-family HTH domain
MEKKVMRAETLVRAREAVAIEAFIGRPSRHGRTAYRLTSTAFPTTASETLPTMLAERLRKLRDATMDPRTGEPLGVREVARRVGISHVVMLDLESGESKHLRANTLLALASFYRVNPEWLMYGRGQKKAGAPTGGGGRTGGHLRTALARSAIGTAAHGARPGGDGSGAGRADMNKREHALALRFLFGRVRSRAAGRFSGGGSPPPAGRGGSPSGLHPIRVRARQR